MLHSGGNIEVIFLLSISHMILLSTCRPESLSLCPPYHVSINGTAIARTDTKNFPYSAYHLYCSPPNALHPEKPYGVCDPYSNPQAQELVQLLPHPEWAVHGYPEKKGDGWVGDPRTWILDVGALSNRLYFYQVLFSRALVPVLSFATYSFIILPL
jgi:hypothetical protein